MKKHLTLATVVLAIVCTSAHAQLPSYLPAEGLMAWWPFNGNANDESGNGNNGIVFGATPTADRIGNSNAAMSFNGSGNYISVPYSNTIGVQQEITVSFWVYFNGGSCGPRIMQCPPWGQCGGYTIATNSNSNTSRYFYTNFENCNAQIVSYDSPSIAGLNWQHVVWTASGFNGISKMYFNGEFVDSDTTNAFFSSINYLNRPLTIGNIDPNSCDWFGGYLDDIAIYNRALTEQEIQNLYTGTTPAACLDLPANLQDGLVGYWPFCGNANDESGNGNDAEVYGSALAEDRHGNTQGAYSFNGTSDFILIPSAPTFSEMSDFTISCWLKKNSSFINRQELLSKDIDGAPLNGDWGLHLENYRYTFEINGGGPTYFAGTNITADSSVWQSIVVTRSQADGRVKIYVNGLLDTVFIGTLTPVSNNQDIFIGRHAELNAAYFSGLIDDITIYNRALSPDEVAQLYAVQSTGNPNAGGGLVTTGPLANVPRGISYQAVARDAQGQAIASSPVNVRFTLHQGTPTGTAEYSESHALTTNEIGLFHTFFGAGTAITSAFDSIVWSNTTKFLQVEIDLGNGYVDMGTQQLMSVPYAYRANEAAAAGTIRNSALPIYPDNAAALADGLVPGEMYRTATGDLKVVY